MAPVILAELIYTMQQRDKIRHYSSHYVQTRIKSSVCSTRSVRFQYSGEVCEGTQCNGHDG